MRADNEDPMRQVTFKSGKVQELHVCKRRVGKPKLDWVHEGKVQAWKQFRSEINQSQSNNPGKKRKYKGSQDCHLITRALDKKY